MQYGNFYHSKVFKGGKKYDSCQSEDKEDCLRQAKSIVEFSIECDAINCQEYCLKNMSLQLSLFSLSNVVEHPHYIYYPDFLDTNTATNFFMEFVDLDWRQNQMYINQKMIDVPRKECLYGDTDTSYKYANIEMRAKTWNPPLLSLRSKIMEVFDYKFNIVFGNLYNDGNSSIGWHSDDDSRMGVDPAIASVSFGAIRKFSFMEKESRQTESLWLEHGSLLIMKEGCQRTHLHSLPKTKKIIGQRVNLTFRSFWWIQP